MRALSVAAAGILIILVGCVPAYRSSYPAVGPGGYRPPAAIRPSPSAVATPASTPAPAPRLASGLAPDVAPDVASDLTLGRKPVLTPSVPPASPTSPPTTPSPQPPGADPGTAGLATCEPAPEGMRPAPVIRSGPASKKVVALTFDDGYGSARTLQVLRILQRSGVNATFFPIALAVKASPATWQTVAAAGFPIANHTYDHARLAGRCYKTQLTELTRWTRTLQSIGVTPLPVMRPPGGAFDRTTRLAAAGAGLDAVVLWDVDTRDWGGASSATIAARALAGSEGSIVLMHTGLANTVAALPRIIDGYRSRGYTFVTIGQLLGVDGPVPF